MSSIERTPNGRWRARYRDLSGRSRSKTFDRKVDANQYLERIGADMQRGEWADPQLQKSIVATWAESWYTTTAPLKPSTRHGYRKALEPSGAPPLGSPAARLHRPGRGTGVGGRAHRRGSLPRPDPQRRLGLRPGPRPRPRRPSHAGQPRPRRPAAEDHPSRAPLPRRQPGRPSRRRHPVRLPVLRPARRLLRACAPARCADSVSADSTPPAGESTSPRRSSPSRAS